MSYIKGVVFISEYKIDCPKFTDFMGEGIGWLSEDTYVKWTHTKNHSEINPDNIRNDKKYLFTMMNVDNIIKTDIDEKSIPSALTFTKSTILQKGTQYLKSVKDSRRAQMNIKEFNKLKNKAKKNNISMEDAYRVKDVDWDFLHTIRNYPQEKVLEAVKKSVNNNLYKEIRDKFAWASIGEWTTKSEKEKILKHLKDSIKTKDTLWTIKSITGKPMYKEDKDLIELYKPFYELLKGRFPKEEIPRKYFDKFILGGGDYNQFVNIVKSVGDSVKDDDFDSQYALEYKMLKQNVKLASDLVKMTGKSADEILRGLGYNVDNGAYYKKNGAYTRVIKFKDIKNASYYVLKNGNIPRGWTLTKIDWFGDSVKDSVKDVDTQRIKQLESKKRELEARIRKSAGNYDPNVDKYRQQIESIDWEIEQEKSMNDSIKDVKPRTDESKTEFVARFMNETKSEYPNEKQRYAVANSYWENKAKDSIHDGMESEVRAWWDKVETWNQTDNKYHIDNYGASAREMLEAMFDMLIDLKRENPSLYQEGKKIYNRYSIYSKVVDGRAPTTTRSMFTKSDIDEKGSYLGTTEWGTRKGSLYIYKQGDKIIAEGNSDYDNDFQFKGKKEFNSLYALNQWLNNGNLNDSVKEVEEYFEVITHWKRDFRIGDIRKVNTLEQAKQEAEKRLKNQSSKDPINYIEIKRFFKGDDGHLYYDPKKYWRVTDSIHDEDIDQLSEEEKQAIDDYKKAIAGTKDVKLLELYSHILREEIEHLRELQSAKNSEVEDSVHDKFDAESFAVACELAKIYKAKGHSKEKIKSALIGLGMDKDIVELAVNQEIKDSINDKESANVREAISLLEGQLAKEYGYTLDRNYINFGDGSRSPISTQVYIRLKELGYDKQSMNKSNVVKVPNMNLKQMQDYCENYKCMVTQVSGREYKLEGRDAPEVIKELKADGYVKDSIKDDFIPASMSYEQFKRTPSLTHTTDLIVQNAQKKYGNDKAKILNEIRTNPQSPYQYRGQREALHRYLKRNYDLNLDW